MSSHKGKFINAFQSIQMLGDYEGENAVEKHQQPIEATLPEFAEDHAEQTHVNNSFQQINESLEETHGGEELYNPLEGLDDVIADDFDMELSQSPVDHVPEVSLSQNEPLQTNTTNDLPIDLNNTPLENPYSSNTEINNDEPIFPDNPPEIESDSQKNQDHFMLDSFEIEKSRLDTPPLNKSPIFKDVKQNESDMSSSESDSSPEKKNQEKTLLSEKKNDSYINSSSFVNESVLATRTTSFVDDNDELLGTALAELEEEERAEQKAKEEALLRQELSKKSKVDKKKKKKKKKSKDDDSDKKKKKKKQKKKTKDDKDDNSDKKKKKDKKTSKSSKSSSNKNRDRSISRDRKTDSKKDHSKKERKRSPSNRNNHRQHSPEKRKDRKTSRDRPARKRSPRGHESPEHHGKKTKHNHRRDSPEPRLKKTRQKSPSPDRENKKSKLARKKHEPSPDRNIIRRSDIREAPKTKRTELKRSISKEDRHTSSKVVIQPKKLTKDQFYRLQEHVKERSELKRESSSSSSLTDSEDEDEPAVGSHRYEHAYQNEIKDTDVIRKRGNHEVGMVGKPNHENIPDHHRPFHHHHHQHHIEPDYKSSDRRNAEAKFKQTSSKLNHRRNDIEHRSRHISESDHKFSRHGMENEFAHHNTDFDHKNRRRHSESEVSRDMSPSHILSIEKHQRHSDDIVNNSNVKPSASPMSNGNNSNLSTPLSPKKLELSIDLTHADDTLPSTSELSHNASPENLPSMETTESDLVYKPSKPGSLSLREYKKRKSEPHDSHSKSKKRNKTPTSPAKSHDASRKRSSHSTSSHGVVDNEVVYTKSLRGSVLDNKTNSPIQADMSPSSGSFDRENKENRPYGKSTKSRSRKESRSEDIDDEIDLTNNNDSIPLLFDRPNDEKSPKSDENNENGLSPYNPEAASPLDLDTPENGSPSVAALEDRSGVDFHAYKDVDAFENIMKSKVKHEARKHKRKKLEEMKQQIENEEITDKSEKKMVDYLIRQSQVEDLMKNVLKQYFKTKEITKDEYKNILKKAVPKVTMSDSPIIPEKIQSLMMKFVRKCKGQRLNDERKRRKQLRAERELGKQQDELQRQLESNAAMLDSLQPFKPFVLNPNLPMPPM